MRDFVVNSTFFGITLSFLVYSITVYVKNKLKIKTPFFNPLLITSIIIIVFLLVTKIDYSVYNASANYVTYWLTPVTICLAIPLYRQIEKLKQNFAAVVIAIASGCVAHALILCGIVMLTKLDPILFHSILPKSVTTAIALGLSEKIGGIMSVTIVGVSIAGLSGAVFGPSILKLWKINEPVAQGLALGTASHAVGTSKAMELGEIQGAMSSLAIVVTGVLTVIVVPIVVQIMG